MRRWSLVSLAALVLQGPSARVSYRLRLFTRTGADTVAVADAEVAGPEDTGLRLALTSDTTEVEALLTVFPERDTVTVSGDFVTARLVGRSRRGLPLWERDGYRRTLRVGWGDTARIYPFGTPRARARAVTWAELVMGREPAGGRTRPSAALVQHDSSLDVAVQAVTRPRRVTVTLTLVRGDTASAPVALDFIPDAPAHTLTMVLGAGDSHPFAFSMTAPDPAANPRARALALDADAVCLRVSTELPTELLCGRLDNVAHRLPLQGGDTLVATFGWPGVR